MSSSSRTTDPFDYAVIAGTALALYWSLYVQPLNGEGIALLLGCAPIAVALSLYVAPDQYLSHGLLGLLAVALGGMAPASVLHGSTVGQWLVGGSPLPLALGTAILVTLCVLVFRRLIHGVFTPTPNSAT